MPSMRTMTVAGAAAAANGSPAPGVGGVTAESVASASAVAAAGPAPAPAGSQDGGGGGGGGGIPALTALAAEQVQAAEYGVKARQHRQRTLRAQEELARRSAGLHAVQAAAAGLSASASGVGLVPQPPPVALPPGAAAAAAAAGARSGALEAQQQLREMAAVELELRQLRQMQAVGVQQRAFGHRDEAQRRPLGRVAAAGGIPPAHNPPRPHPHPPLGLGSGAGAGALSSLGGAGARAAGLAAADRARAAGLTAADRARTAGLTPAERAAGLAAADRARAALTPAERARAAGLAAADRARAAADRARAALTAADRARAALTPAERAAGLAAADRLRLGGGQRPGSRERSSSAGHLGAAAADLLARAGDGNSSPQPLRGAAGAGAGTGVAALATGLKLRRPHSAGPLGFMADLVDETDDGVGTSRAEADTVGGAGASSTTAADAAAAPGTLATAAANTSSAVAGRPRSHSAGALRTISEFMEDAGGDAEGSGDAGVSPHIAAAQARVEALEKQLQLVRQPGEAKAPISISETAPPPPVASVDPDVDPHIAAAQARVDALKKKLAQQKELQQRGGGIAEELLYMRDAEAPDARIVAAQARADALEKQLVDQAAAKAEAQARAAAAAATTTSRAAPPAVLPAAAAALPALPFQRLESNPRRPARNSGFPLPRTSTKDDAYVPPKIKNLDSFRAAFDKMRTNMTSKNSNKRKASEMSDAGNAADDVGESEELKEDDDDKIPLPLATFNGDIFSNMIYRGKIDLKEEDWTVTGMYSINEKSTVVQKIRQRQAEQILHREVEAAKAEAAAAMAAAGVPETQLAKRKKGWTPEQEQTIAELKKQKAELDEKLARHQAAKSKEKAAAAPGAKPGYGGGSLLPPVLPNAAIDISTGAPKASVDSSVEGDSAQNANKGAEVSNEALGVATSLLDLMPRVAKKESGFDAEGQEEPENQKKRSADELTAVSATDQDRLSSSSENKMMADLQTMGKRKKRRLTPPGTETPANGLVNVGGEKKSGDEANTAADDTSSNMAHIDVVVVTEESEPSASGSSI